MNFSQAARADVSDQMLKVAALKAVTDFFNTRYETARRDAEKALKAGGIKKVAIRLPDGVEVGEVTVTQPSPDIKVDEPALMAFVEQHQPAEVEEYLDSAALLDEEVIAYCRAHRDDLVKKRIRPVWRNELTKRLVKNDGYAVDETTGESTKVADVVKRQPTGAFALSKDPHGARSVRLMTALLDGDLDDVIEIPGVQARALPTGGFGGGR